MKTAHILVEMKPWILNVPKWQTWPYKWNIHTTPPFTHWRSRTFSVSLASVLYSETFFQHVSCQKFGISSTSKLNIFSNLTFKSHNQLIRSRQEHGVLQKLNRRINRPKTSSPPWHFAQTHHQMVLNCMKSFRGARDIFLTEDKSAERESGGLRDTDQGREHFPATRGT